MYSFYNVNKDGKWNTLEYGEDFTVKMVDYNEECD